MRILIAHSFYRIPGGEDRYARQQAELLGDDNEVFLLSRSNVDLPAGIRTAGRMIFSPSQAREVKGTLERWRPDVVHVHNVYPAFGPAVHIAARKLGVPLVMTVHNLRLRCPNSFMFTEGAVCRRCARGAYWNAVTHRCFSSKSQAAAYASSLWVHRYGLRMERWVDRFIAPSGFMRNRLVEWGLDEGIVEVVRNFTDIDSRDPGVPGKYGVFAGRLSPEKGLDVLLHALRAAGDPPFRIVGDGPATEEVSRLKEELRLDHTELVGRVPSEAMHSILAEARFLALPSLWEENAPLAALEAMARGRPLLVTGMGGLPELVARGGGVVCAPGDAQDMADKLRRFDDDGFCERQGRQAWEFASSELLPEAHKANLEAIYTAVVGE
ncbi:MAG: glycosyltransferase, partial [Actinomycetota bacterium]